MDKYLEAIEKEEAKKELLLSKKEDIMNANKKRADLDYEYSKEENRLGESLKTEKKRKFYLQNRKSLMGKYVRKSLFFGIGTSVAFFLSLIIFKSIESHFFLESFAFDISNTIYGLIGITGMMSAVEFRSVAREFLGLTSGYTGDVEKTIEELSSKLENVKSKKYQNQKGIEENKELLNELETAMQEISDRVTDYRTRRNQLIESLIGNLDYYINDFQYREIDIHKLIEKKIH